MTSPSARPPSEAQYGLPCCGHRLAQHSDPEFSGYGNTTRCRCCREAPPLPLSCGYCRRIEGHEPGCPIAASAPSSPEVDRG